MSSEQLSPESRRLCDLSRTVYQGCDLLKEHCANTSNHLFNPLLAIRRSRELLDEILSFVDDLAVLELHDADSLKGLPRR